MLVNPGELNKSINIYSRDNILDGEGFKTPSDTLFHSCYASFKRVSGDEVLQSNANFGEVKAKFLIRYTLKELKRNMIIKYNNKEYEIQYIDDIEDKHEFIEIYCSIVSLDEVS